MGLERDPGLACKARELTRQALPCYTLLPLCAHACHRGLGDREFSIALSVLYLLLVEFLVFVDHYYVLHRWQRAAHSAHHEFKARDLGAWVAFAFHPLDGLSQGMPTLYAALVVPVSWHVVYLTIACVGAWTLAIHHRCVRFAYPLMGYEYHAIHHEYNWFNFGLFTVLFDTLWGTIRHPPV